MYCTHCGKEINQNAVMCPFCGHSVQNYEISCNNSIIRRNINGLSIAGFVIALSSIALGYLSVWINHINYTGFNFQFLFVIPLIVALALSVAGTVKSGKLKSGRGLGIAGILISGGILVGALVYYLFAEILTKIFFVFILFLLPFI